MTQRISLGPIKCQSRSWSQRGTKVNESHRGENLQIATKPLPDLTNRKHRKLIGAKTMSSGTKYRFYSGVLPIFQNLNCKLQRRLSDLMSIQQSHQKGYKKVTRGAYRGNTILNQPYLRRVSTDRLEREDSQLAVSLESEPGPTPAGKTLPHSNPKTRFRSYINEELK